MRGPIVVLCSAAALFIGQALHSPHPPVIASAKASVVPSAQPVSTPHVSEIQFPALPVPELQVSEPQVSPPAPERAETPSLQPVWGADKAAISTAGSFVYSKIHQATPLPDSSFAAMRGSDGDDAPDAFTAPRHASMDFDAGRLHVLSSRGGLCSAIASVAQANELPVPFFANLIWQESSFRSQTISSAGALGIAQFTPETAVKHGLTNPFEPMHALFVAGKHLRKLNEQFGNLGLAAAAYNAGPQRVRAWMAERRTLPSETRAYVMQITGRPADLWLSSEFNRDPEAALMPAKAPCAEVAVAVQVQAEVVRMAKLMAEFAKAANAPAQPAQEKSTQEKGATEKAASGKPVQEIPLPRAAQRRDVSVVR